MAIILLAVMVFSDFQMSTSLAMDNSSAVEETEAVSYTHLDVYKRQDMWLRCFKSSMIFRIMGFSLSLPGYSFMPMGIWFASRSNPCLLYTSLFVVWTISWSVAGTYREISKEKMV